MAREAKKACVQFSFFVFFSKACKLQTICLETELRRLQAEQERTSREEKEKKATLAENKDEQFERKTEAMVPEREYRAVLQVSQLFLHHQHQQKFEFCQKNYTTEFSSEGILHTENA